VLLTNKSLPRLSCRGKLGSYLRAGATAKWAEVWPARGWFSIGSVGPFPSPLPDSEA